MKKIFISIAAFGFVFFAACKSDTKDKAAAITNPSDLLNDTTDLSKYTTIQWLDSIVDFGSVHRGEKVKVVFHFRNSGDKPLYIIYTKPGCGCTVADFTKGAIMPNQQGEITAQYDSNHGNPGEEVRKSIFVTCNAKNAMRYSLVFTGMVR